MGRFLVDANKCVSCGQCAADCLVSALKMEEGHPVFVKPELCIGCLHCFAICPVGAITMDGRKPEDAPPLASLPSPESMTALLRQRRSIRAWKQENMDPDLVDRLLKLAWSAPTGRNERQLHISVIDDLATMDSFRKMTYAALVEYFKSGQANTELLLRILGPAQSEWLRADRIFRHAPHCVIAFFDQAAATGAANAFIYLSAFEALACTYGVGTLWCGYLNTVLNMLPDLAKVLGLTNNYRVGYPMLFGWPDVCYSRGIERYPAHIQRISL